MATPLLRGSCGLFGENSLAPIRTAPAGFPMSPMLSQIQFEYSREALQNISRDIGDEIERGLATKDQMIRCLPSYVCKLPTGREVGAFVVVDLGGSNLRVGRVKLLGEGRCEFSRDKWSLPEEVCLDRGKAVFTFIAEKIKGFLQKSDLPDASLVGFTFSYPVQQSQLAHGVLLQWNKAISADQLVGRDVVELLETEMRTIGLSRVSVGALTNDTVATLAGSRYRQPDTHISVILGTGTNAAFLIPTTRIGKLPTAVQQQHKLMVINSEWGAYGQESRSRDLLCPTELDRKIDANSNNPGKQTFEKMISGMYLGEIVRLALVEEFQLAAAGGQMPHALDTKDLSKIEEDDGVGLVQVGEIMESRLGLETNLGQRRWIKEIVHRVSTRSAQLCAAGIVAIYNTLGLPRETSCVVAIDGGLYENYPTYTSRLSGFVADLLPGDARSCVSLQLAKSQSLIGAATIVAALESQQ